MILVTGGTGYIGSHVCLVLPESGLEVAALDNLFNRNKASLDGAGIREFIHVVDFASGHSSVSNHRKRPATLTLGTGKGSSVLEAIGTFEAVSRRKIPFEIEGRAGDVAICCAGPTVARETLGWQSARSLAQMCEDHWRWQLKNKGHRGVRLLQYRGRSTISTVGAADHRLQTRRLPLARPSASFLAPAARLSPKSPCLVTRRRSHGLEGMLRCVLR